MLQIFLLILCAAQYALADVVVLTSIAVTSAATADALTVDFAGGSPTYQILKKNERLFEINFQGARMPTARGPVQGSLVHVTATGSTSAVTLSVLANRSVSLQVSRSTTRFTFLFRATAQISTNAPTQQPRGLVEGATAELLYLKYADVNEVLGMLGVDASATSDTSQVTQMLVQSPPVLSPFGGTLLSQQPNAAMPVFQGSGGSTGAQRVNEHISLNRRLNAVLISGSPAEIEVIKNRILLFDVSVASITLETKIVELTENAARNVGLSFPSGGTVGTAGIQIQSFQKPGFEVTLQAQILAQIEKGGGRIVATPSIQALSGQSASILTGDAIPVVTTTTFPGSPPTIQQQIQYINVGVQLQILPRYSADGYVTSKIMSQVSSVTAFLSGNIPQISQRQAITQATVKDGESYVIGGLIQENEIRNIAKIPGLGDLPLIGGLFRSERSSAQKTSLYIVVTPHVRLPSTP